MRVKSFLETARILFAAAHWLHLIKRASFVGGIRILNGIISIFSVYYTSFHVCRDFIVNRSTIDYEAFIVKVIDLWLRRLWRMGLLLLFGRRRDINIHLDVGVYKIWILQIELRHHTILSCLSCSLFVQTCSFRDSMMVWMMRQLIVTQISLTYLHRDGSLTSRHQMMLMVIMSQSIACVGDMPNGWLWDSTIWTNRLSITSVCILNCMALRLIWFNYWQLIVSSTFALMMIHRMLHLIILEISKWHCCEALFAIVNLGRVELLKVLSEISRSDTMVMFWPHCWWWCFCPTKMMIFFKQLHVFLLPISCVGHIRS